MFDTETLLTIRKVQNVSVCVSECFRLRGCTVYIVQCTLWIMPRWPPGTFTKEAKPWFRLVVIVLGTRVSSFTWSHHASWLQHEQV